jgi:hypothetical protein
MVPRILALEERLVLSVAQPALRSAALGSDVVAIRRSTVAGTLDIQGTSGADTVEIGRSTRGFVTLTVNGVVRSGDMRDRAAFDRRLLGLRVDRLTSVRLAGDDPLDTVVLNTVLGSSARPAKVQSQAVTIAAPVTQAGTLRIDAQSITVAAAVRADSIMLSAAGLLNIDAGGSLTASNSISLNADRLIQTGKLAAPSISITAGVAIRSGTIAAPGGSVNIDFGRNYVATEGATIDVSSSTGTGGKIRIDGGATGHLFNSGTLLAKAGEIRVSGQEVVWVGGGADAAGGSIHVGGGWQGSDDSMAKARTLEMSPFTTLKAGTVVLWSEEKTTNQASIVAPGGAVEVSSKGVLNHAGSVEVGTSGRFLLDPKNIVIADNATGGVPMFQLVNPTPSAGDTFGATIVPLSTGRIVVTDPGDDTVAANAGAVYLYNGATGALISTLTGSTAEDQIGSTGITVLTSGNYVIRSSNWDNGVAINAGAVTWASGTSGVSGAVSASNSLVGTQTNDRVGITGVTALTNGNYVVSSQYWSNLTITSVGAATWANGTTGIAGPVSTSNSLYGTTANDFAANNGVTALTNGNYVIVSSSWDNASIIDSGAVTWANGATGLVGPVSTSNSVVGSTNYDFVGIGGVTALTNGNYVFGSQNWNNGATIDTGAVTWGNGASGTTGVVSVANSLVGAAAFDSLGSNSVTALSNGNYVVRSAGWDNGATANVGAVTWGNGTSGSAGTISAANSLIGVTANDQIGSGGVIALTNGNYVIVSPFWSDSGKFSLGAVTWASGSSMSVGTVTSANSLTGSTSNDRVGASGVTALTNGNYVVRSQYWANGAIASAGAATWGNGSASFSAVVSAANSLIGGTASDQVGSGGVTPLTNGNYVISSPNWANGANSYSGAVTWGNGATGIAGTISAANSLVGTTASDYVGISGVTALTDGDYVVRSPNWNNGAVIDVGAVTWGNGATGTTGNVATTNSIVGATAYDQVGSTGVLALSNGNYVVRSQLWDNGFSVDVGALTWGGTTGSTLTGMFGDQVSVVNSIVGIGNVSPVADMINGTYLISQQSGGGKIHVGLSTPLPSGMTFAANSEAPAAMTPGFITAPLNAGTSTTLQANNDISLTNALTVDNPSGAGGSLTVSAGRSVTLGGSITTDGGNLTVLANASASDGVVNAQRDAGAGGVSVATGVTIDAGTGSVSLTAGSATGLTERTSGGVSVDGSIRGGSISLATANSGSGTPDITVNDTLTATGSGGISVNGAGAVTFAGTSALTTMASRAGISVVGGSISLRGTVTTNNGDATFTGPVTITGLLSTSTGSGAVTFAGGLAVGAQAVSIGSTVTTTVTGTLSMDGGVILTTTGGLSVGSTGSLTGHGSIMGSVSVAGSVAPGSGATGAGGGLLNLGSGTFTLAGTSSLSLNGSSRTSFDKIIASGVSLAGATLDLDLSAATLSAGDSITLVDNVSAAATSGTFAGLAQGAIFTANGQMMQISYSGGDGNDVVVTKVADITASFSFTRSGFFYVFANDTYRQTITLTNLTGTAKRPGSLKFTGLPGTVSVAGGTKIGADWFLNVSAFSVPGNGSLGIPVEFAVSSGGSFTYTLSIIGG